MKKILLLTLMNILIFSLSMEAQDFSITIDAQKDAFYQALTGPADGVVALPAASYLLDVGTPPNNGKADVSAIAWFAYDEDYLYCYVEVKDDTVTAANGERFQNDCIELKFDPDPASGLTPEGTKTSNCRITAKGEDNAENPSGVDNLNGSGHLESAAGVDLVTTPDDYARRLTSDGYVLEFRVPFDYINEMEDNRFMISRIENGVFGMAINIGDNDSGVRDHMLQWSAGHTDGAHSYPAQLGSVTFLADHKLKLEAVSPRDASIINDSADVWYTPNLTPQDFAISIDAEKDAFYEGISTQAEGFVYLPAASYLLDVGTPPNNGNTDVSAKVWFSYDEDYLYCYAEVKDDTVTAANGERFQNDCIELKFDPDPASGLTPEGTKTSNCRITAKGEDNAENPSGVDNLNGSGHLESASGVDLVTTPDDYARRLTSDGYVLEFRVPFDYINEMEDSRFMIDRVENNVFGMAINIGDNDSGVRDHMLQWSAGHTDGAHSYPAQLGSVTFLADHKLKLEAVSPRDASIVNDSADVWYTTPTGIHVETGIPETFYLSQNYPNPFNPSTTIKFSVTKASHVTLKIYNTMGQEVAELFSEYLGAGVYTTQWNASEFASGIYYYQIKAGNLVQTRKLVLLK